MQSRKNHLCLRVTMLVVSIRRVCVYIVSEVCSKKLFVYVFLYAVQSMAPHTGCMTVLLYYMKALKCKPSVQFD